MIPGVVAGDFGVTTFIVRFVDTDGSNVDISSYTTLQILLAPANGSTTTFTAAFTTDGTDGRIQYQTVTGNIPSTASGLWKISGVVTRVGQQLSTHQGGFDVFESL